MDSEKIKELKEFIQLSADLGCWYKLANCEITMLEVFEYINELESENAYKQEHIELWFRKNEEKKKRIAELETKNEVLCVELSRYTEHCIEMKNGTLKQFAERLKENLEGNALIEGYDLEDLEFDGETIQECIDETLKEFIKGK